MAINDVLETVLGVFRAKAPLAVPGITMQSTGVTLAAPGSYTPDLRTAFEHNVTITAPGAYTINAPIDLSPPPGFATLLYLHIRNASGGVITVTWDAKYHQPVWVDPVNGNGAVCLFHHDPVHDVWYRSASQTMAN